jgi:hypothetical protein
MRTHVPTARTTAGGAAATGTRAGVGASENASSWDAGVEAARAALSELGGERCDLAIIYATDKHDPVRFRDGVRSVIGPRARLIGGVSMGIITRDYLGYDGYQVGVAAIASDSMTIDMFIERGLPGNERAVGRTLARQIQSKDYDGEPNILLMYDSVKGAAADGLALNLATPLIQGMKDELGTWPPAAGVGMLASLQFNRTFAWFDDRIEEQCAMALVLSGGVRLDTVIMHGCRPASDYHTITSAEENVILEIDGRPALAVIDELVGAKQIGMSWEEYPVFVTLGVNRGDKFGPFNEEEYANRLCMAVDKERRALVMFGPDLTPGSEVQLMRRSIDFQYIRERAEDLYRRVEGRRSILALYIDCAARASAYCGTEGEEAEEVQKAIGAKMPLLGMYSGVEIARVGDELQELDWTGVGCILSEERPP